MVDLSDIEDNNLYYSAINFVLGVAILHYELVRMTCAADAKNCK